MLNQKLRVSLVLLCGPMTLCACSLGDPASDADAVSLESTEQAVYSGWTDWTSEEYPPITCDGASLMAAMQCSGGYCDNLSAYCSPTGGARGGSYWTSYFSEEGTSWRTCPGGYWVTGISCQGWWCDNVALQCTYIGYLAQRNCHWTGWFSEEYGGYLSFGGGYATGAACSGAYCDNMSYYVCQP